MCNWCCHKTIKKLHKKYRIQYFQITATLPFNVKKQLIVGKLCHYLYVDIGTVTKKVDLKYKNEEKLWTLDSALCKRMLH